MLRLLRFVAPLCCLLLTRPAGAAPEQDVTPPKLVHFEQAPYPAAPESVAPAQQITVVLRLDIDPSGAVTQAEVVESGGAAFDTAAVEAARKFTFEPARRGEEPIAVRILFKYVFTPPEPVHVEPVENLAGEAYHRWEKKPLPGVKVEVASLGLATSTDDTGHFAFEDVPPGDHVISFTGDGLVTASVTQHVEAGTKYDVRVGLEPVPEPVEGAEEIDDVAIVRGARVRKEVVESTIEREQGERVAGTQGDVVKVVQTLGGVARTTAGAGELVVWGASPSDTRLYVDWIPVPRLFHVGGARSILASDFVSSLTLVPGGFGAEWGRAIGGYVRVDTARPDDPKLLEKRTTVDFIDAGGGIRASPSSGTWTAASGRMGLLSHTFDAVASERSRQLVPIGDYWDYQGKLRHQFSKDSTLDLLVLGSNDRSERGIPSLTPDAGFRENTSSAFHRIGLKLERVQGSGTTTLASWAGFDDSSIQQHFDTAQAKAEQRAFRGGLRLEESRRLTTHVLLRYGLDLEYSRTSSVKEGALTLPAREGDIVVFGQAPGNRVNSDEWDVDNLGLGLYVSSTLEFAEKTWIVEPGLRIEPNVVNGDRVVPVRATEPAVGYSELELAVDPRLRVTWQAMPQLSLYAAVGRYHQPPATADLSPVFGNPVLEQPRALHVLAGTKAAPKDWLQLELTGFFVQQDRLTVRSSEPTPPIAKLLTSEGEGRSYGAQSSVKVRWSEQFFAWATYSLMRAERRASSEDSWRLFDSDQTHVAQVVGSWAQADGFEVGASIQLSSGFPRTPVTGASYDTQSGDYNPIFGDQNSSRLPTFFQTSLRLGWKRTGKGWQFRTWLDIQNLTNRGNAEEIIYTADYAQRGFVKGLPILPVLGAEFKVWIP